MQMFLRQPTSRECQVRSHVWSLPPSPQSTSCSGADGSLPMLLRQPPSRESQSLSDFLSSAPPPQSLSDFLSLSPSPQLTFCSGADGSDVSMDQDDNHELEGDFQDLFLYPSGPVKRLPESRLVGRHFMTKAEPRRRCALCTKTQPRRSTAYQSKISLFCKQCNVFLHFECFEEYHTMAHPVSQWAGSA